MMWPFNKKESIDNDWNILRIKNLEADLAMLRTVHAKCQPPRDWGVTTVTYHNTFMSQTVEDDGVWSVGPQFVSIPKRDGGSLHIDRFHILRIERTPQR